MNPQPEPEIGTIEHCKRVLAEWKAKAEASEKEHADLKAEVSQLCITGRALLARAETAEERLKEAKSLLRDWMRDDDFDSETLAQSTNTFLDSQKEEK